MTESNGRKRLNGGAPALIRHVLAILVAGFAGVFALGVLWAEVDATGDDVVENTKDISTIQGSINSMVTEQKVLSERSRGEQEVNKEFRDKTSRALDRILSRLPRRERPAR